MRRTRNIRSENQLALVVAEIERLKAITTRVTDGRVIVTVPGTTFGDSRTNDGDLPPLETSEHVLYGSKHTDSFLVTAAEGVSLTIFIQSGQVWAGGNFVSLAETTLQMTDAATNYVHITSAGVVASNTMSFPLTSTPLAEVVAAGGTVTVVNDRRSYLLPGAGTAGSLHDADQIIDADGDTSVEVERGADDDTIRLKAATVDVALIAAAGQWQLPITGSGAGLLIGGEGPIYRGAAGTLDVGIDGTAPAFILHAQDGVDEGGELHLLGAAANADWVFDNFAGGARLHSGGSVYYAFYVDGMEIGLAANPFNVAIGGGIVANTKLMMAGSVVSADHAFTMHTGAVLLDPADGFSAFGLFSGGTVVATAGEIVANAYSAFISKQAKSDTGDITNAYGLYVETPTIGTNNWALYSEGVTRLVGLTELPTSGSGAGLLIGGDALLYRVSADILRTPDSLIVDTKFGVGVTAIPHNAVGWARVAIKGPAASASGPHMQFTVNTDDQPLMQIFPFTHNNMAIMFDAYYDGAFKSSSSTANFAIYKLNGELMLQYASGSGLGVGISFATALSIGTTGQVALPVVGSGAGLLIGSDVQLYRSAADILYIPDSVAITGDTYWETDGSGLPYGHMQGHEMAETVAVAVADTWYELTSGLATGEVNLAAFANNHELLVTKAGRYLITWCMSLHTSAANDRLVGTVAINNTADVSAASHSTVVSANKHIALAGTTILDLAASDAISMAVMNHDTARDIVVEHVTLAVVMVGGT